MVLLRLSATVIIGWKVVFSNSISDCCARGLQYTLLNDVPHVLIRINVRYSLGVDMTSR